MAQRPSALACHLSSVASSDVPLACTAKSMIVVAPPHAAAWVPVSKVSAENVPPNGISMCVWASIPPGSTYLPAASITRSAAAAQLLASCVPGAAVAMIRSPSTSTSVPAAPAVLITVPPLMSICIAVASGSRLDKRPVLVGAPVAIEGPQVPNLCQLAHVQVADHDLLLRIRGRLADKLAARIREVRLAIEVVVAERFHADPVDRADVVLVGHRSRGLLKPPQVVRQAAAGGRRVEHDPRAGQAKRPPPLREVAVVADVHADPADGRVEYGVAEVAGPEVELLPEPLHLRKVGLAVLAEVTAVGVDHGGRVVVETRLLLLVHGRDEHDAVLPGHVAEQVRRRAARDRF